MLALLRAHWGQVEGCLPGVATLTFRETVPCPQQGQHRAGAIPLGPGWGGGFTALCTLTSHLKEEGQVDWKAVEVTLGLQKQSISLAPLPPGLPAPWEPPPKGSVCFVNHSICASLVSATQCEDRDLS